jgi:hypothetical protein
MSSASIPAEVSKWHTMAAKRLVLIKQKKSDLTSAYENFLTQVLLMDTPDISDEDWIKDLNFAFKYLNNVVQYIAPVEVIESGSQSNKKIHRQTFDAFNEAVQDRDFPLRQILRKHYKPFSTITFKEGDLATLKQIWNVGPRYILAEHGIKPAKDSKAKATPAVTVEDEDEEDQQDIPVPDEPKKKTPEDKPEPAELSQKIRDDALTLGISLLATLATDVFNSDSESVVVKERYDQIREQFLIGYSAKSDLNAGNLLVGDLQTLQQRIIDFATGIPLRLDLSLDLRDFYNEAYKVVDDSRAIKKEIVVMHSKTKPSVMGAAENIWLDRIAHQVHAYLHVCAKSIVAQTQPDSWKDSASSFGVLFELVYTDTDSDYASMYAQKPAFMLYRLLSFNVAFVREFSKRSSNVGSRWAAMMYVLFWCNDEAVTQMLLAELNNLKPTSFSEPSKTIMAKEFHKQCRQMLSKMPTPPVFNAVATRLTESTTTPLFVVHFAGEGRVEWDKLNALRSTQGVSSVLSRTDQEIQGVIARTEGKLNTESEGMINFAQGFTKNPSYYAQIAVFDSIVNDLIAEKIPEAAKAGVLLRIAELRQSAQYGYSLLSIKLAKLRIVAQKPKTDLVDVSELYEKSVPFAFAPAPPDVANTKEVVAFRAEAMKQIREMWIKFSLQIASDSSNLNADMVHQFVEIWTGLIRERATSMTLEDGMTATFSNISNFKTFFLGHKNNTIEGRLFWLHAAVKFLGRLDDPNNSEMVFVLNKLKEDNYMVEQLRQCLVDLTPVVTKLQRQDRPYRVPEMEAFMNVFGGIPDPVFQTKLYALKVVLEATSPQTQILNGLNAIFRTATSNRFQHMLEWDTLARLAITYPKMLTNDNSHISSRFNDIINQKLNELFTLNTFPGDVSELTEFSTLWKTIKTVLTEFGNMKAVRDFINPGVLAALSNAASYLVGSAVPLYKELEARIVVYEDMVKYLTSQNASEILVYAKGVDAIAKTKKWNKVNVTSPFRRKLLDHLFTLGLTKANVENIQQIFVDELEADTTKKLKIQGWLKPVPQPQPQPQKPNESKELLIVSRQWLDLLNTSSL